jgi:hypothetical protein
MGRPSAMMGGGRMTDEFDALRGRAVESCNPEGSDAFDLRLIVDEVVTVRDPPRQIPALTTTALIGIKARALRRAIVRITRRSPWDAPSNA